MAKTRRRKKASEEVITSVPKKKRLTAEDRIGLEREIRRYVRARGSFRKDLSEEDKEKCKELLKRMGRSKIERDKDIIVPGLDKPTVAGMNVK